MIRHMLTSALGAGLVAGLFAALLHFALLQPLILAAEGFEIGAAAPADPGAGPAAAASPAAAGHGVAGGADLWRNGLTVAFQILTQVAFALLLVAGFGLARMRGHRVGPRDALLWGIAGFVALQLAPSLGLAPGLPGMPAADLFLRQVWWAGTVAATAAALALLAFGNGPRAVLAAAVLFALPHLIGAPVPDGFGGLAPPELASSFAARVLGVGLAVWAVLGWTAGRLWSAPPA